jgi:hypothetical protein
LVIRKSLLGNREAFFLVGGGFVEKKSMIYRAKA